LQPFLICILFHMLKCLFFLVAGSHRFLSRFASFPFCLRRVRVYLTRVDCEIELWGVGRRRNCVDICRRYGLGLYFKVLFCLSLPFFMASLFFSVSPRFRFLCLLEWTVTSDLWSWPCVGGFHVLSHYRCVSVAVVGGGASMLCPSPLARVGLNILSFVTLCHALLKCGVRCGVAFLFF